MELRPLSLGWTRPPRDSWVEARDDAAFDFTTSALTSAEDLLRNPGQVPPDGRDVVYRFQRDCSQTRPGTPWTYTTNMAKEIGVHLAGGVALLMLCGVVSAVMGSQLDSFALIPAGLILAGSLGLGVYQGHTSHSVRREEYARYGERIPGKLVEDAGADGSRHLTFYPHGDKEKFVRLARHAAAEVVPGGEPSYYYREGGDVWWNVAEPVVKKKDLFDL